MSYQFPAYTSVTPTGEGSSIKSSLLTPPLTPHSEHDVPYRPTKADKTSLSMKKPKHKSKKRKSSKARNQRQSAIDDPPNCSATLPADNVCRRRSFNTPYGGKTLCESADDAVERSRRWTLPSKSASTRVFTPLGSTVKQATLTNEVESPAMITLRRASTNKRPKRVEMTFFPEPKFGNERSTLLSYIVSTFTRADEMTTVQRTNGNLSANSTSMRSASVGSDGAHPASTFPAATVCTETFVESTLALPDPDVIKPTRRRCSTKYVTADTSLEVIWDENDLSTTTTQDSSQPSITSGRRPSMAAVKLEAQLASSMQGSRRASTQSRKSSRTNSQGSVGMFLEQVMTPGKLSSLFPRLQHESVLRDLPRSRGSRGVNVKMNVGSNSREANVDHRRSSAQTLDLFPPLPSRRSSVVRDGVGRVSSTQQADGQTCRRTSAASSLPTWRTGAMVGSSSHSRRRSSGNVLAKTQRAYGQRKHSTHVHDNVLEEAVDNSDTTPLLHRL